MIRILTLALLALVSGCATLPEPAPEPAELAPDEPSLEELLTQNDQLLISTDEVPLPTTPVDYLRRALESFPTWSDTQQPELPKDFWTDLTDQFQLPRLPDEYAVESQWRSLRIKNPELLSDFLARGQVWLHYIASELKRRDMPLELALLPYVESGFQLTARSHRGAAGPWQLMPATAEYLGLTRTRTCDQRLDVLASTGAALDYLSFLAKEFDGDWFLAIAAYNSGPGRVGRAIKANRAAGKPTDFWSLRLPKETRQYVPRLLALAEVVRDPARYQLTLPPIPTVPVFETLELDAAVDLQLLAEWSGSSIGDIRQLNPCLRRFTTPVNGALVAVPVGTSARIVSELAALPPEQWAQLREYQVKSGDTLGAIALRFDTSVGELKSLNGLNSNLIRIGQVLRVNGGNAVYAEGNTTHVVRSGESLWTIARRYNTTIAALESVNTVGRYLKVGQQLRIPLP